MNAQSVLYQATLDKRNVTGDRGIS